MSGPVYLDTSALVRRAEAAVLQPTPRNIHSGTPVTTLLTSPPVPVATCEVGLLEFHDVVTMLWRDSNPPYQQHDEAWAESAISQVMADIAQERLSIRAAPARAYEQAITLVTMTTRMHGRKFRVWDAVHLVTATAWASELGQSVELWTTDGDFDGFVALYPHFGQFVSIKNLDN